ncbi:PoNe immunity protein domain-containing protein [Pseudorhodoferax sp.]|uniref:PoNe immunity protein domain-containing protein n=1 Tax=Pseudorhodoferax sp. TaxID=1993553 RepID=UPI0039E429D9
MSEAQFIRRRRDPLYSYAGLMALLCELAESAEIVTEENIARRLADAGDAQANVAAVRSATEQRAWEGVEALHGCYTAGVEVDTLAAFFPDVLQWWETFARYDRMFDESSGADGRRVPHLDLHGRDFWRAVRLTSFGILLGHFNLLSRVATLWDDGNEEMDGLLERLIAPFVPGRAPPPDTCTRHRPYVQLLEVFDALPDERPALMSKYMDEWYAASCCEPYYGSQKKGREHSYLGLWSFEAAAVTYVLQIDDSSYRDKDFYPRDLVDYARSRLRLR